MEGDETRLVVKLDWSLIEGDEIRLVEADLSLEADEIHVQKGENFKNEVCGVTIEVLVIAERAGNRRI